MGSSSRVTSMATLTCPGVPVHGAPRGRESAGDTAQWQGGAPFAGRPWPRQAQCVLLDWGLTKQLNDQRRLAACKLIVAVGMKDTSGIVEAFREMGATAHEMLGDGAEG